MCLILWKEFIFIATFIVLSSANTTLSTSTPNQEYKNIHHKKVVNAYFSENRQKLLTSNLGTILYKNVDPDMFRKKKQMSKTYKVMLLMFWSEFVSTYLRTSSYDSESVTKDILRNCMVKNCKYFSIHTAHIDSMDAVIFPSHQTTIPTHAHRKPGSRWIMWQHGSPMHKNNKWTNQEFTIWSNFFNWTMGYRSDSDIPIPFGRTVGLPAHKEVDMDNPEEALASLVPYWDKKQHDTLAMALAKNCNGQYYTKLSKEMKADIFFERCSRHEKADCTLPEAYLFYIAFEESSCIQYMTEVIFHHAYSKGAIPVISGPLVKDCKKLLPPKSFLHVRIYRDIPQLVKRLNGFVIFMYCYLYAKNSEDDIKVKKYSDFNELEDFGYEVEVHETIVNKYYDKRKRWKTSNLGSVLFKNVDHQKFVRENQMNRTFLVLFWRYWNWQKNRHIYNYGSSNNTSQILEDCSVKNCEFTGDDDQIDSADAVIIHMQKKSIPIVEKRDTKQRWIFLSDESPINTFSLGKESTLSWTDMYNVFNWTMTYRSDSDIPVPYGRTVPLQHPVVINQLHPIDILHKLVPYWKDKALDSRAMVLTSNCMKARMRFIQELQKFIQVDVFGRCSDKLENKKKCPGHFTTDCMLPASYLFYIVIENSKCSQYITEKVFQHAFSKGAIPVIMGPSLKDCENLLPPNSYLHVENYENVQKLSEAMKEISRKCVKL
ncbi:hypothetical protein O0L34_g4743 [Tuta absoluta]|nr:hypothetical protein O0L34_g4743 [Tuta absoluta]